MIAVFLTKDSQLIGKHVAHTSTSVEVNKEGEFFNHAFHVLDHGMLVLATSEWAEDHFGEFIGVIGDKEKPESLRELSDQRQAMMLRHSKTGRMQ